MAKKANRVRNWRKYNEALLNRGRITFWFSQETLEKWLEKPTGQRGRPKKYSDSAIICALTLKAIYHCPFRQTEGFITDLVEAMGIEVDVPDYSLLCKRQKELKVPLPKKKLKPGERVHILVDTTGIKVFGEGEWKVRQHGFVKHRLWRKLHLSVNRKTQEIESFELTTLGIQDCEGLDILVEKSERPLASATGDGTYDRFSCYDLAERHNFHLIAPPQKNAVTSDERRANKKKACEKAVIRRDNVIKSVRILGLGNWKIARDYHKRSLAETAMFRMKTIFGNRLSSRIMSHQIVETAIRCRALNMMTHLSMTESITV
jgi:hypothetical protein